MKGFAICTKSVLENKLGITEDRNNCPETLNSLCNYTDILYLSRLSARLEKGLEMLGRNVNVSTVMISVFYEINDTFRQNKQR